MEDSYFKNIINDKVLNCIPRILSLLDKNPYSRTYGSFDRKYWHYKILDFSCGMQQELVLPLAYVWKVNFPGNRYHGIPRIKDYIEGVFLYHEKCSHKDGSLDDYFPHERAFGATAYALAALTEAMLITGIQVNVAIKSFEKSGSFLASYKEAGRLSNHLAIASLALTNLYLLTGKSIWKEGSEKIIDKLEEKQDSEGWFPEYEGCDLGYQTVTVEFLARQYRKAPSKKLMNMVSRNLTFLNNFFHPDGSFGGEFGSRNTYNFYPGGFAVLSSEFPEAANILFYFFKGFKEGSCNYLEDDGVFGHILSSYVTTMMYPYIRISEPILSECVDKPAIKYYENSGLFVGRTNGLAIFGSLTKGGCCKIFKHDRLIWSDTGFIGELNDGTKFCQNNPRISTGLVNKNRIELSGYFKKYLSKRLDRIQMIAFRIFSIFFGWSKNYSNLIRYVIQRSIIYNVKPLNIEFKRDIIINEQEIRIEDEIINKEKRKIVSLHRSTDCVNMHVITSDSFQIVHLLSWEKMSIEPNSNRYRYDKNFEANE